jgi:hypothetical protein
MYRRHAGHDTHLGFGDFRQPSQLAPVRHAHLDYGRLVFRLKTQQGERQSVFVIQVAFGFQHTQLGTQ